ncbi:MAG TPA: folate-binding protein [Candidatus Didemnitutus sp.]|nr:folate-binding protein [Candidatus Didemnitutus sp.]
MYFLTINELHVTSCVLRISGPDAYTYLQGQFTQELRQESRAAAYGLWLNQKGKTVADSTILRLHENTFILVSPRSPAQVIRERLESYLVADEVELADESAGWSRVVAIDDGAAPTVASLFGEFPARDRFTEIPGGYVFRGRLSRSDNLDCWLVPDAASALAARLRAAGAREVDASAIDAGRIESGLAAVPDDIGPSDLPNEGGLENDAISYTKGCFLGQEVMARLKNLGQVRRFLHVVRGPGELPVAGAPLYVGDKKVGDFRSSARRDGGFVAMAMLSLASLEASSLSRSVGGPADVSLVGRAGSIAT